MSTCPVCLERAWRVYGDGCERCLDLPEDDEDAAERRLGEHTDAAVDAWKDGV